MAIHDDIDWGYGVACDVSASAELARDFDRLIGYTEHLSTINSLVLWHSFACVWPDSGLYVRSTKNPSREFTLQSALRPFTSAARGYAAYCDAGIHTVPNSGFKNNVIAMNSWQFVVLAGLLSVAPFIAGDRACLKAQADIVKSFHNLNSTLNVPKSLNSKFPIIPNLIVNIPHPRNPISHICLIFICGKNAPFCIGAPHGTFIGSLDHPYPNIKYSINL